MHIGISCACYIQVHAHTYIEFKFNLHIWIFHKKYHHFDIYHSDFFRIEIFLCMHSVWLYAFYVHVIYNCMHIHTKNRFGPHCCIFHKKYHQFDIYDLMNSFKFKNDLCMHIVWLYALYVHDSCIMCVKSYYSPSEIFLQTN